MGVAQDRDAAAAVHLAHHADDVQAGFQIQVAGGFVGQDDGGIVDESARDRDALLLAAGEFGRFVPRLVAQPDQFSIA